MKKGDKSGQATIFIIVAILIIAFGVLIYLYYPQIKTTVGVGAENPSAFIQTCLEDEIETAIEELSSQGGSLEPVHYFTYQNQNIEYLCYTSENYKTCVVQQPMLKSHIESEIKSNIETQANKCFDDLKESYENKGYQVSLKKGVMNVELLPKRVVATFNNTLVLTKQETERFESFSVILNNNIYELISIANSIINWESTYGDAETTTYMNYYRDLKIEKKKQSEGTTIYIIGDRNNENKFQFASRSIPWPPGYS